jgi:hypothetical protein
MAIHRDSTERCDRRYLKMLRSKLRPFAIAAKCGVSLRRVQIGISRARLKEVSPAGAPIKPPRLEPIFPITSFTPLSACPHHGPIAKGSSLTCMVCGQSGMDGHPALRRDPRTEPKPDRNPEWGKSTKPKKNRRERRSILDHLELVEN